MESGNDDVTLTENYQVVTWAVNTTGSEVTDEICEIAAYNGKSSFSQYIIPYCDVKTTHWKRHKLGEFNTRKFRCLKDYQTDKILSTKTEIHGLRDFVLWLEKIHEKSGKGIILVSYEYHNYIYEILLESLRRCKLNEQFLNIIKGFANCYDISEDHYRNKVKYCKLNNIYKALFNKEINITRALSKAEACYQVLAYIGSGEDHNITSCGTESNISNLIKSYVVLCNEKENVATKDSNNEKPNENNAIYKKKKSVQFKLHDNKNNEVYPVSSEPQKNIMEMDLITTKNNTNFNSNKYKIVGWAVNATGRYFSDEIFHIAAFTPDSMFSQHIMPKSRIRYFYRSRHNVKVLKVGNIKQLKDMQTKEILDTVSETSALQSFIEWLEQIRDDKTESVILLYHEYQKNSLNILLESLRRSNLTEDFSKVVGGFVNTFHISQDKYANVTKIYTLDKMSELLLKKKIEIGNAMIRAQVCYDIILHMTKEEFQQNSINIFNFICPYINSLSDEEEDFAQYKINNQEKHLKKSGKKINN